MLSSVRLHCAASRGPLHDVGVAVRPDGGVTLKESLKAPERLEALKAVSPWRRVRVVELDITPLKQTPSAAHTV